MIAHHVATRTGANAGPLFEVRLAGVAVDDADRLYALGDERVRRYSREGALEEEWTLGLLGWSVATEEEQVWIGCDGGVRCYSAAGALRSAFDDLGRLGRITAIAPTADGLVLADATNRAVHRYTREGRYLGGVGAEANTRGFMLPNGVLDLVGDPTTRSVLVAHPQKHRVERYASTGTLVGAWGRFGEENPADFGGCCNPTNIAVGRDGTVAVSEKAPPRIKVYNPQGRFELVFGQGHFDPNAKNLDLAFDSNNRLYATDPVRRVVQVFRLDPSREGEP